MLDMASPPPISAKKQFGVKMAKRLSRGVRGSGTRDAPSHKQSKKKGGKGKMAATATGPNASTPSPTPAVCQSCGRPIVPVAKPEDGDGSDIPGLIQLPRWMKDVLRRLPGSDHDQNGTPGKDLATGLAKLQRMNDEDVAKGGRKNQAQPTPGLVETGLPSDQDEPEVNPNQLSNSSTEDMRPGRVIAERQARLRRAQMLLAKTNCEPDGTAHANRG